MTSFTLSDVPATQCGVSRIEAAIASARDMSLALVRSVIMTGNNWYHQY